MHNLAVQARMALPDFSQLKIDEFNEADVRAEIIDPILRELGYGGNSEHRILRERELKLKYNFAQLGRKKPGRDPELRGCPDYICEVRNFGRWVVEAKPPSEAISIDDIEQAHSYANHGEVQAHLYVLSNGRQTMVFETNRGPRVAPIVTISINELNEAFPTLENLLSPDVIKRRFRTIAIDPHKAIFLGFGSMVKIRSGISEIHNSFVWLEEWPSLFPKPNIEHISVEGWTGGIIGDECYRGADGSIVAHVRLVPQHKSHVELLKLMGLETQIYVCRDDQISGDPSRPSRFEWMATGKIPPNALIFDQFTHKNVQLPVPATVEIFTEAVGHVVNDVFKATFFFTMFMSIEMLGMRMCIGHVQRGRAALQW